MNDLIVRRATPDDIRALAALIEGFADGHPAKRHARCVDTVLDAFFGAPP